MSYKRSYALLIPLTLFLLSFCSKSYSSECDPYGFLDFWARFRADSTFEKKYTKFPLTATQFTDLGKPEDTTTITKSNWKPTKLDWLKGSMDEIMILCDKDNHARVLFRGRENGIHVTLFFQRIDKIWLHTKYEDLST